MQPGHEADASPLRTGAGRSHAPSPRHAPGVGAPVPGHGRGPLWQSLARLGGLLPATRAKDEDPWTVLRGRGDAPFGGSPYGRLVRTACSEGDLRGPRFDAPVPPGGYTWWYIDAISEDGQHGLTIIAFMGSVFSPYYKRSGRGDPLNHSCLNVALYGPNARWVMTERPRQCVEQGKRELTIGPSHIEWDGDALVVHIEERDTRLFNPFRRLVRGKVRVSPEALNPAAFALDGNENHIWHCMAPRARIEVEMDEPGLSWSGKGYFDHNRGSEPLEDGFRVWHWSRAHMRQGSVVCYEGERRDGSLFASAIRFNAAGIPEEAELPSMADLPPSKWRIDRRTRSEIGLAKVQRTWEDTPFYSRSELTSQLYGEQVVAVQESLDMRRFSNQLVQFMLPYRMPRGVK